ncbi:MAG: iron-containing alcohol dehydrogenase [Candidatus Hermodarchaeota archaeon]
MWYFTVPPKLIFGEDALDGLTEEVEDAKKIFIVTDKVLRDLGFLDKLTDKLKDKEIQVFDDVEPESSIATVKKGGQICLDFEPDYVIGLGGGSVIDTAKGIWLIYERSDLDLSVGLDPFTRLGLGKKSKLIAVPTTSGTGSDATWAFIITDKTEERKATFASRELIPSISVLDPIFPADMPKRLTASTALDALTHAVEAYISTWANDFSDAYAVHALRLIFKYLPKAVTEGSKDMLAREKIHNAATMAGMSFSNSQVGNAHSMGHSIGGIFNVLHGEAVGIALPYLLEFYGEQGKPRLESLGKMLGYKSAEEVIEAIRNLMKTIGAPLSYAEVIPDKEAFLKSLPRLVELANGETGTIMSPRIPEMDEFEKLYLYAYEGKKIDF